MRRFLLACCFAAAAAGFQASGPAAAREPLTVLVMDPLALPLSCPCVKGHAQRLYDKLGAYLETRLDRPVKVLFSDDLAKVLHNETKDVDVIIGKRSVVRFDAKINDLAVRPAMMLTGRDGKTTVTGLIVVRKDDPAKKLADIKGYTIFFGPPDCDEKFTAAAAALKEAGVALPEKIETRPGCSDSVVEMLEHPEKPTASIISSYAAALLEGCGTIEKGSIRVIGETRPVPFVTVYFTGRVDKENGERICAALTSVKEHSDLMTAMETSAGFVPVNEKAEATRETTIAAKPAAPAENDDSSAKKKTE